MGEQRVCYYTQQSKGCWISSSSFQIAQSCGQFFDTRSVWCHQANDKSEWKIPRILMDKTVYFHESLESVKSWYSWKYFMFKANYSIYAYFSILYVYWQSNTGSGPHKPLTNKFASVRFCFPRGKSGAKSFSHRTVWVCNKLILDQYKTFLLELNFAELVQTAFQTIYEHLQDEAGCLIVWSSALYFNASFSCQWAKSWAGAFV